MEAILQPIVTFYRESLEKVERKYESLRAAYEELLLERRHLMQSYERLEDYATEQDARLNALRDVIDRFIDQATVNTRRDLLDEFNAVAREHNIDFDEDVLTALEETESDTFEITSVGSIDDMFN